MRLCRFIPTQGIFRGFQTFENTLRLGNTESTCQKKDSLQPLLAVAHRKRRPARAERDSSGFAVLPKRLAFQNASRKRQKQKMPKHAEVLTKGTRPTVGG